MAFFTCHSFGNQRNDMKKNAKSILKKLALSQINVRKSTSLISVWMTKKMPKITGNLWVRHIIASIGQHNLARYLLHNGLHGKSVSFFFFMDTVSFTDVTTAHYGATFWHSEDRATWYILVIKPTRRTISQIYFGIELCMFQTGLLSIIRSLVLYTKQ